MSWDLNNETIKLHENAGYIHPKILDHVIETNEINQKVPEGETRLMIIQDKTQLVFWYSDSNYNEFPQDWHHLGKLTQEQYFDNIMYCSKESGT